MRIFSKFRRRRPGGTRAFLLGVQLMAYGDFDPVHHEGIWNLAGISLKASSRFQVEAQAQWTWGTAAGAVARLGDPRLGFGALPWLSSRGFFYLNANAEIPITEDSKRLGRQLSPGSWQQLSFQPGGTRFGFYAEHWLRWYRTSSSRLGGEASFRRDIEGNLNPGLTYALAPGRRLELRLSLDYRHLQGLGFQSLRAHDLALQPGLTWLPSPNWNIRPFLSVALLSTSTESAFLGGLSTTALF